MTRLIAVFVALLFALGAVSVPIVDAAGTTTKPPAKSGDAQPETKGGAGKPMTKKLDINSASKDDLEQLPGIGDALSALRDAGAAVTLVAGSGPTAAGLFEDIAAADRAAGALPPRYAGAIVTAPETER